MPKPGLLVSDVVMEGWGEDLARTAPDHEPVVLHPDGPRGDLSQVEIAFFSGDLYPDRVIPFVKAVAQVPELRWLQSFSAGVDNVWFHRLLEQGARVSTASGANARPVAQTAILLMLAVTRRLAESIDHQRAHRWERLRGRDVEGTNLVVLGLGPIGLEVAKVGEALGMHVLGLRRTVRGDEPCETWPLTRLGEALARADQLVLALPLAPETHHLIDARALALMKPAACLINVGRGELVDEAALVESLQSGRLGGAGLDVFEVEPLPEDSPLWDLPNVVLTPHHGGFTPMSRVHAVEIFLDNLGRWQRGEALRNEVFDPAAGADTKG